MMISSKIVIAKFSHFVDAKHLYPYDPSVIALGCQNCKGIPTNALFT